MSPKKMEENKMPEKTEKTEEMKTRISSSYTRVVGNIVIDVVNTRQNPDVPAKAKSTKWVVLARNGKKTTIVGRSAKKYPAIDILLAHEKILKAAAAKKDDE